MKKAYYRPNSTMDGANKQSADKYKSDNGKEGVSR